MLLIAVFIQILSLFSPSLVHAFLPTWNYPVIYVLYGELPMYLRINIELAALRNPVVVISDFHPPSVWNVSSASNSGNGSSSSYQVMYESMNLYSRSAEKFAPHYIHLAKDQSSGRQRHELHCIQRWYVLRDYMQIKGISHALFGDGDASIFVNVHEAFSARPKCDVAINIEMQYHKTHWVGAGESSLWTTAAITDFCAFTMDVYEKKKELLHTKHNHKGSAVVDMSVLWLWWVAHKSEGGWEAGRPWAREPTHDRQKSFDEAFVFTKSLQLPPTSNPNLNLCNGMDVVNRTVFDHMHGWNNVKMFSLDLEGEGRPYGMAVSLDLGGKPESLEASVLAQLTSKRLYFNSLHYQGYAKSLLPYDICRILVHTGSKSIQDSAVKEKCLHELKSHPKLPCQVHGEPHICA